MTYPRNCCKGCENRTPVCHCFCEEYAAYKKELNEYNEAIRKQKEAEGIMWGYIRDNHKKRRWTK